MARNSTILHCDSIGLLDIRISSTTFYHRDYCYSSNCLHAFALFPVLALVPLASYQCRIRGRRCKLSSSSMFCK